MGAGCYQFRSPTLYVDLRDRVCSSGVNEGTPSSSSEVLKLGSPDSVFCLPCLENHFQLSQASVLSMQQPDIPPLSMSGPDFHLRISASNQLICLRNCVTLTSFRWRLVYFFVVRATFCFTLPETTSALAYTRKLSLHMDRSLSSYSLTIKSSMSFNSCLVTQGSPYTGGSAPIAQVSSFASFNRSKHREKLFVEFIRAARQLFRSSSRTSSVRSP